VDRCALFVDAGYALSDGALAVHGTRHRDSVSWDYAGLVKLLAGLSRDRTGLPVLRCYWYEATVDSRRTPEHETLADIPGLKLRLGKVRPGRREGVETEIRRDLTALARNKAVSDVIIVSAEEDLSQVISDVQDQGVKVAVMHIAGDGDWTVSRSLRQECDDIIEISAGHLRPYVDLIAGAEPVSRDEESPGYPAAASGSGNSQAAQPAQAPAMPTGSPLYSAPVSGEYPRMTQSQSPAQNPAHRATPQPATGNQPLAASAAGGPGSAGNDGGVGSQGSSDAGRMGSGPGPSRPDDQPARMPAHQQYQGSQGQPGGLSQTGPQSGLGQGGLGQGSLGQGGLGQGGLGQGGLGQGGLGQGGLGQSGLPQGGMSQGGMSQGGMSQGGPTGSGPGRGPSAPQGGGPADAGPGSGSAPGSLGGYQQNGMSSGGLSHLGQAPGGLPQGNMPQNGLPQNGMSQGGMSQNGLPPGGMSQGGMSQGGMSQGGMSQNGLPSGLPPNNMSQNGMPQNGMPSAGLPTGGPPQNGLPSGGLSSGGLPSNGLPGGLPQNGLPSGGLSQNGMSQNGMSQNGLPQNGLPSGGLPQNGLPQNGLPSGLPQNGLSSGGLPQNGLPQNGLPSGGMQQNGPSQNGLPSGGLPPSGLPPSGFGQHSLPSPGSGPGELPRGGGLPQHAQNGPPPQHTQGGPAHAQNGPPQHGQGGQAPGGPQNGPAALDRPPSLPPPRQLPPGQGQPYQPGLTSPYGNSQPPQSPYGGGYGSPGPAGPGYPTQNSGPYDVQLPASVQPAIPQPIAMSLADAVQAAHAEGFGFGEAVARDAPALWLEAVLARKPRMPSDLEARLLQGSALPIDSLLHDEVRHALRRGFWDALERSRR
jgi:hypothetical protein